MTSLHDLGGVPLAWRQPRLFRHAFELTGPDNAVVARLERKNIITDRALAECADGRWEFRRAGLLSRRIVLRREGSDVEAGSFSRGFFGGKLELAGGREYRIRLLRMWPQHWAVLDADGRELARIEVAFSLLKHRARLTVPPEGARLEEIPLLVLFSWYHIVHPRHRGDSS